MKSEEKPPNTFWLLRFVLYGVLAVLILVLIYVIQLDQPQPVSSVNNNQPPAISTPATGITQSAPSANGVLPAFPGAEGFGTTTQGGRFGRVIIVSNLEDTLDINSPNYVGSFRWALDQPLPNDPANPYSQRRVIVFKVGGEISLVDKLILKVPYVTIAGQTAPGDGITLRGETLFIATHDVIVRGIRIRVGDQGEPSCCRDGLTMSTSYANSDVYNIVIDHCSVSWAIDENLSTWVDPDKPFTAHDITIQWSIVSEGLHDSIHIDEGATTAAPHSMGLILGQDAARMTVHHNLLAHNWGRNPRISGIVNSEVLNNVIYGWGDAAVEFSHDKSITHVFNNYFRANSDSSHVEIRLSTGATAETQISVAGNLAYDPRVGENLFDARTKSPDNFNLSHEPLFVPSNVAMSSAEVAYSDVLNYAGVTFPVRDAVDQRIVEDVKSGAGKIINSQDQVGGWPAYQGGNSLLDTDNDGIPNEWELAHGLNPGFAGDASSPSALSPSGYTWLEEYINSLIPPYPQR